MKKIILYLELNDFYLYYICCFTKLRWKEHYSGVSVSVSVGVGAESEHKFKSSTISDKLIFLLHHHTLPTTTLLQIISKINLITIKGIVI